MTQRTALAAGVALGTSANGNLQFVKTSHQALYEAMVQTLLGKGGQLKSSDQLVSTIKEHLIKVVNAGSYDFVANLALYAKNVINIRSTPIILVVEFAKILQTQPFSLKNPPPIGVDMGKLSKASRSRLKKLKGPTKGYPNLRKLVCGVITRADQLCDMYAYSLQVFGSKNKIPLAIKRGIADASLKFNAYNYAKYNRAGAVKLRDVIQLVHPTPSTEQQSIVFHQIMTETLPVPYTWETELSANGKLPLESRKSDGQLWTELIHSNKLGYMALLRNLRNIVNAGVSYAALDSVCRTLMDPVLVKESKQLPHDFIEAYNIIQPISIQLAKAVSMALDLSVGNLPSLGNTWVALDFSGSMGNASNPSDPISQATFLAACLIKSNASNHASSLLKVTMFGSGAVTIDVSEQTRSITGIYPNSSIIDITSQLLQYRRGSISGSTNFQAALREFDNITAQVDTAVVLTDGEINGFPYHSSVIQNKMSNIPTKLVVNLSSADTTPFLREQGWYSLAGWSPAVFKWVEAMKQTDQNLVNLMASKFSL